ncbi:MAG: DNA repair protein RecN [Prevotella sp.]|nr:DNA repair protein RecN [Prevotella sp.]
MIKQLYIKNFTLIDTLDMTFQPGFSVITGETGAGKSIILGAIALLLGQRADSKAIKSGAERCIIEAHFDLSRYSMEDFFTEYEIDYDATDCILRRELTASGKSRAFINDTPVQLSLMRLLGQQLVDIHSQHQNLLLQEEDFQLNVVDIIANDQKQLELYHQLYQEYLSAKKAVKEMQEAIDQANDNQDFLRFQLSELNDADLSEGIQEELEQERETLSHAEDIKSGLFAADQLLSRGEGGIIERLKETTKALDAIKNVFPDILDVAERTESCYIELKDIAGDISSCAEDFDFDPQRLEIIHNKLDQIYSLEKKHHVDSVEQLIAIRDELARQLDRIDNSEDELKNLQAKETALLNQCRETAAKLSQLREKAARKIEKEMLKRLVPLGIPHVRFEVQQAPKELSYDGADRITFLFSANTSTPLLPVSEVASGGEIARVMLSLKAMISGAVKLPTIIFDEIDTGVSGKTAEMMAKIMQEMGAADRQVISITHLPQIAALGTTHYKVYKEESQQGTISHMQLLQEEERVQEIAQMLSGSNVTEAAVIHAKELLKQSKKI